MEIKSHTQSVPNSPNSLNNKNKDSDNKISLIQIKRSEINQENLEKSKQHVIKNNYWNDGHEAILQGLQKNSNKLFREYQKSHIIYKKKLRLYRIPIIIMSGLSGFLSISNSGYIPKDYQQWISLFVGFVNLMVTIISLIENFKKIDTNVNKTYTSYIQFKKLHDEISLLLNTSQNERECNGYDTTLMYFNRYESCVADSPILEKIIHDHLDNNSPDNKTQTIVCSGSDELSENKLKKRKVLGDGDDGIVEDLSEYNSILAYYENDENDDIESQIISDKDKLKKILSNSNGKIKKINTGVLKKTLEKKNMMSKSVKNTLSNYKESFNEVNRFQNQFDSMEKEVNKQIDNNVFKVNLENNMNINKENFPKLTNIKPSNVNETKFNELNLNEFTEIKFNENKINLINIVDDCVDDLEEKIINTKIIDPDDNSS